MNFRMNVSISTRKRLWDFDGDCSGSIDYFGSY